MAKKLDIGAVLAENIGFLRTLLLAPDDGFAGLPARLQALAEHADGVAFVDDHDETIDVSLDAVPGDVAHRFTLVLTLKVPMEDGSGVRELPIEMAATLDKESFVMVARAFRQLLRDAVAEE